jgi:formate C-acetyltransferase
VEIVSADYAGHEPLRQEVLHAIPHYGNDEPLADSLARRVSNIAFDSLLQADNPDGHLLFPALYSLHNHFWWGKDLPATPDGRHAGQPISENQSPAYGRDRGGLSALLLSAAALPHHRTVMGGLNVRFGGELPPAAFAAMLDTFFELGGVHLGLTCVDRETLLSARAHPERHRSLCVRVAGFSEYFCALSPAAQQELIDRTQY